MEQDNNNKLSPGDAMNPFFFFTNGAWVISLLVQIQLQVQSIYPLDFKAATMGATAGVNLLEGADELVHSAEQSLLPISWSPGAAVVYPHLRRQFPALGKVNQPHANAVIVVNDEDAGANDLVAGKEGRLLDDQAHVLQSLQQLLLHGSPCGQELFDGLANLLASSAGLQILDRRTSAQAQRFDPETL